MCAFANDAFIGRNTNIGQLGGDANNELVVADEATLALVYPPEAMREKLPGFAFMTVLSPSDVWMPNVASGPQQAVCLGARMPIGVRVRELVLATYGALTVQTIQLDEKDSAGLMSAESARWWQQNQSLAPLSREPFLGPIQGPDSDTGTDTPTGTPKSGAKS